ncbi:MAG: DUF2304 domain-containing protein [DPANN group archaeon]|nr:DUF2304 domain-containing protein [DPANN group archaeon]
MEPIQIIGILFGMFLIYLTFLYNKREEFTRNEQLFWSFLALGIIFVALFPNVFDPIIHRFAFARTLDLVVVLGFIVVISISFYTYFQMRKTQKKLEEVVRKIALKGDDGRK